jgi:hypothetical protein
MRVSLRTAVAAALLAWRASPAGVLALLVVSMIGSTTPVAGAWLTKLIIDGLVGVEVGRATLAEYVAGLGAVGLLAAVCPRFAQYVRAEPGRLVGLRSRDELYTAVDRFVGLGPFEDPTSVDRLRLAPTRRCVQPERCPRRRYRDGQRRGDVALVALPDGSGMRWILKRVAALPGDPALAGLAGPHVPAGMLVLLGDNPHQVSSEECPLWICHCQMDVHARRRLQNLLEIRSSSLTVVDTAWQAAV